MRIVWGALAALLLVPAGESAAVDFLVINMKAAGIVAAEFAPDEEFSFKLPVSVGQSVVLDCPAC